MLEEQIKKIESEFNAKQDQLMKKAQ